MAKLRFFLIPKNIDYWLILILLLAAFFRFYNFLEYQVWNTDDEIMTASIRHIIRDKSPLLLIPNFALEIGLGPYYYWALSPFYFLTNFNLVLLQSIASGLGVLTTLVMYQVGKVYGGAKLAKLVSFFYACSFLISFYERRLWPLTLNTFIASLTLLLLLKIVRGKHNLIPFLAIPIGLSFHTDPSMLVLTLGILVSWLVFKFPIFSKYTLYLLLILSFFFLPYILAEFKYNHSVSRPLMQLLKKPFQEGLVRNTQSFQITNSLEVYGRVLAAKSSKAIEKQVSSPFFNYEKPKLSPLPEILVFLVLFLSSILLVKKKDAALLINWIILVNFMTGIFIYNRLFGGNIGQNYFAVTFPIFILILSSSLIFFFDKYKWILGLFVLGFFLINLASLVNSSVSYPLYKRIELVRKAIALVGDNDISLIANNGVEGGWTELFIVEGKTPVRSDWYDLVNWVYSAYSLYPNIDYTRKPEKTVLIRRQSDIPIDTLPAVSTLNYKEIRIDILNN